MNHLLSEQRVILSMGQPRHSLRAVSLTGAGRGYIKGTWSLLPNVIAVLPNVNVHDLWQEPGLSTAMVEEFHSQACSTQKTKSPL